MEAAEPAQRWPHVALTAQEEPLPSPCCCNIWTCPRAAPCHCWTPHMIKKKLLERHRGWKSLICCAKPSLSLKRRRLAGVEPSL